MVARIVWNIGAGLVHRALNKSRMRPGMGFDYPAVWRARPGFLDCDINLHLNNAAYLFNMELARWHFSAYAVPPFAWHGWPYTCFAHAISSHVLDGYVCVLG